MKTYYWNLKVGINRSREFEKKELATHSANVGLRCDNGCSYCSTPSLVRTHLAFSSLGVSAFQKDICVIDDKSDERIRIDIHNLKSNDTVMLCTTTDAWSPESRRLNLGRKCLEVLLKSHAQIRILSKNTEVKEDFDLIKPHAHRVMMGISLTGPPSKGGLLKYIEPCASPVSERISTLNDAHQQGFRTYGMLCPLMPGIGDDENSISELFEIVLFCGAEKIWIEPLNNRGRGIINTINILRGIGEYDMVEKFTMIRNSEGWSNYAFNLIRTAQKIAHKFGVIEKVRILLYPKRLTDQHRELLRNDSQGIIWL